MKIKKLLKIKIVAKNYIILEGADGNNLRVHLSDTSNLHAGEMYEFDGSHEVRIEKPVEVLVPVEEEKEVEEVVVPIPEEEENDEVMVNSNEGGEDE